MTDPIRATIEAPKRVEGVGELALELVEMAEAASNGSRFGDAHFLKRAADLLALSRPAPPAEGEVGELVEELRGLADYFSGEGYSATWINLLTDATDLLEQRHPAPVPVSERPWEREGWCDGDGRCWCMSTLDGPPPRWWLVRPEPLSDGFVLPAHALPLPTTALPLPAGEVQQ